MAAYVRRLRQAQGVPPAAGARQTRPSWRSRRVSPSPHAVPPGWCCGVRPSARRPRRSNSTQLYAQSAEVAEAIDLAQAFTQLVRQRQPAQLDPWLKRATTSTLEALQRFAKGLYEDYEAVKAGVTCPGPMARSRAISIASKC